MKIGILISTGDSEIIWNAFRFANLCMNTDVTNEVSIFMHGKAVEYENCDSKTVQHQRACKNICPERRQIACVRQVSWALGDWKKMTSAERAVKKICMKWLRQATSLSAFKF